MDDQLAGAQLVELVRQALGGGDRDAHHRGRILQVRIISGQRALGGRVGQGREQGDYRARGSEGGLPGELDQQAVLGVAVADDDLMAVGLAGEQFVE